MSDPSSSIVGVAFLLGAAYLCGSVPTGVLVGRWVGADPRRSGSGNIGATNVARTAGAWAALLTLCGDVAKGCVPVLVARSLSMPPWVVAGVGVSAFLGHVYSVFLHWSGGKGVATAFGVFLALAPVAAAISVTVFAAVAWTTRYVSLASMLAAAALPVASLALHESAPVCGATIVVAVLIVLRHRENLLRLRRGAEPQFHLRRLP